MVIALTVGYLNLRLFRNNDLVHSVSDVKTLSVREVEESNGLSINNSMW